MIGPIAFAVVGVGLLVYDHLNQRVPALVFWLTLGLIVSVFLRMVETNRRRSRTLAKQRRDALNDPVTGLRNRRSLEADIAAAASSARSCSPRPGRWGLSPTLRSAAATAR